MGRSGRGKPRPYKGMEWNSRISMQGGGGEKIACKFGGFGGLGGRAKIV